MWARAFLLVCVAASAQTPPPEPDYFPLEIGNRWEYSLERDGIVVGEVLSSEQIDGRNWFRVRWLNGKDYWLRKEGRRVLELDRKLNQESVWADFRDVSGGPQQVAICIGGPVIGDPESANGTNIYFRCGGFPWNTYQAGVGLVERSKPKPAVDYMVPVRDLRLVNYRVGGKELAR